MNNLDSNIRQEKLQNSILNKVDEVSVQRMPLKNIREKNFFLLEILLVVLMTLLALGVFAQQDVSLTQYSSGLQLTNPAYVGTSGRLNVTGIMRNQWLGFEGAPKSQVLLVNSPLLRYHLGVGLTMIMDEIGPTSSTLLYANVAYNFNLNDNVKISMGLNGGCTINKLDNSILSPLSLNDPTYYEPNQIDYLPNFGAGIYIYSPRFYFGFSTPKLLKNSFKEELPGTLTGTEEQHFFLIAGYLIKMSESWKAKPSISVKMVKSAPFSIDITANAIYRDKFWFGTTYRYGDAIGLIFQYQISNKFRIGYSYDFPISEMLKNTSGSHEILISYDLLFKDRKNASPRYF